MVDEGPMNIGLLVTELSDSEVKKICIGATKAARDREVTLVIMPGKYLANDKAYDNEPYAYQYNAVFDYAKDADFDALIIDIERIGSKTTILKRNSFLKKFENIPILTLSEYEGYTSVNNITDESYSFEQLGYEAVCDAIFFAKNQVLPPASSHQNFSFEEKSGEYSLSILQTMSNLLFHRKYDNNNSFNVFTGAALSHGVKNSGVLLYEKKEKNTIKYPWKRPDHISMISAVIGGKELESSECAVSLSTEKIVSTFSQGDSKVFILGSLFVEEYQIGLLLLEFLPAFLVEYCFDNVINLITGAARLSYLENELSKTTEELYAVQEELARDDSVLDHIGDQDYLTGGLNRRGFFAKAYDLLKENFIPGKNAVVAYIYMESLKGINDMFGHEEGDRAVKKVFKILEEVFGEGIYGRIRGDEFAVIFISDDVDEAENLRERMSEQNARLLNEANRYINHLQYSICEFSYEDNLSLREMLKETDENLKRIKGNL